MTFIEDQLEKVAKSQAKYPFVFITIAALITAFMFVGLPNLRLEGDINAQMPQDLDAFANRDKLNAKFGGTDTVIVLIYLDQESLSENAVRDIRDPRVLQTLIDLDSLFSEESSVSNVASPALFFRQMKLPQSLEESKAILSSFPQLGSFFSDDYTAAIMYLSVDVGTAPDKINRLTRGLEEDISKVSPPPGTDIAITGSPQILATVIALLEQDALFTFMLALFLIAVFLILLFRGRGALTILPIVLAVSWMYGTMAWLDIPLSIATAGVGALILGLSVEYDVFYVERFEEEYIKLKSYEKALISAVPKAGYPIIGSSLTTMSGFFALMLAVMPMLQNLGFTLGIGIFYSVVVDIFFNPVNVLMVRKTQLYMGKRKERKLQEKLCDMKAMKESMNNLQE
jgi:hydrophobe/amphiphile efflux-3 (HAE3) family protein